MNEFVWHSDIILPPLFNDKHKPLILSKQQIYLYLHHYTFEYWWHILSTNKILIVRFHESYYVIGNTWSEYKTIISTKHIDKFHSFGTYDVFER